MLYYFECVKCMQRTGLLREDELPEQPPTCLMQECSEGLGSKVVKRSTNVYVVHCTKCKQTSGLCSDKGYEQQKQSPPKCLRCNSTEDIVLLPPHVRTRQKSLKKRKRPGLLGPEEREHIHLYDQDIESLVLNPVRKKRRLEDTIILQEPKQVPLEYELGPDLKISLLATIEGTYKSKRRRQTKFDKKHGKLLTARDPSKTGSHEGRIVSLSDYRKSLSHSEKIGKVKYPKLSKSSPTIVNSTKIVSRDTVWDYRDLGPNSFLRRLCSLLYMLELGKGGTVNNPIEVQAMWAAGSLFVSSNNYSFSELLFEVLQSKGSLRAVISSMQSPGSKPSKTKPLATVARNYGTVHLEKMREYKRDFINDSYPDYFEYKWDFVFGRMRQSLGFDKSKIKIIKIANDESGYEGWTMKTKNIEAERIYVVMPQKREKGVKLDKTFKKKWVHAEQLFYPILMRLDQHKQISKFEPAFVGGVKTPCRTCAEVLISAKTILERKLILPTDAKGHYWKASGIHVPDLTFDKKEVTLVFGTNTRSDNIFNTEMPPSPTREESD